MNIYIYIYLDISKHLKCHIKTIFTNNYAYLRVFPKISDHRPSNTTKANEMRKID